MDAVLGLILLQSGRKAANASPNRILVANGAHLGDAVLATAVLPALRHAFPNAKIGVLTGSWSQAVWRGHPLVDWIHIVDHWRLNRSNVGVWAKWRRYLDTRTNALKGIRSARYDIAIDLYYFFPNSVLLLWQAGIPIRVGYTSAGFGPLLTLPVDWSNRDCSVIQYHAELLRQVGVDDHGLQFLKPSLPAVKPERPAELTGLPGLDSEYLVLHAGTGHAIKEWPLEKWRKLAALLSGKGFKLVFTGLGEQERVKIDTIVQGLPNCSNACAVLDWQGFVSVISHARLLIGVDSIAGHIAAAVGTPGIVIGNGLNNPHHWRPQSDKCVVLMHAVPCAPCYRKHGCEGMECVRGLSVDSVFEGLVRMLGDRP